MRWILWGFAGLVLAIVAAYAALGDFANDDPGLANQPGRFDAPFLAVSDADMVATAYADGQLEPLPDAQDALTLLENGAVTATIPASNSVISWPQVVDRSDTGRFAAVVETRGPPPAEIDAYDNVYTDFPSGTRLALYRVDPGALTLTDSRDGIGLNLQSVEFATNHSFVVMGSETPGAELVTAEITADGRIGAVRQFALKPPFKTDDQEQRIRTIHVAPDGVTLAVNVANRRIQFYRLRLDAAGLPTAVTSLGRPSVDLGRRLAVGKWTPDGSFFIVTDVNWADSTLFMLTQGPGKLFVLRPPTDNSAPDIISSAPVGRSPEGFDISPNGTRIATINMERTYLPELPPLFAWQGRRRYSVSLLTLDPDTGALKEQDRLYQAGILPEDVIFDRSGRNLAVAVYHRRSGRDRERGFIDFFSITDDDQLTSQGVTQAVERGAHDLVRIP